MSSGESVAGRLEHDTSLTERDNPAVVAGRWMTLDQTLTRGPSDSSRRNESTAARLG